MRLILGFLLWLHSCQDHDHPGWAVVAFLVWTATWSGGSSK